MAEGEARIARREGISACPKNLVAVTCAKISVACTVKIKRVEPKLENLSGEADSMWGGVISALELWAFAFSRYYSSC
eukprot:1161701-Pelagomonas_calceolata.AAC.1